MIIKFPIIFFTFQSKAYIIKFSVTNMEYIHELLSFFPVSKKSKGKEFSLLLRKCLSEKVSSLSHRGIIILLFCRLYHSFYRNMTLKIQSFYASFYRQNSTVKKMNRNHQPHKNTTIKKRRSNKEILSLEEMLEKQLNSNANVEQPRLEDQLIEQMQKANSIQLSQKKLSHDQFVIPVFGQEEINKENVVQNKNELQHMNIMTSFKNFLQQTTEQTIDQKSEKVRTKRMPKPVVKNIKIKIEIDSKIEKQNFTEIKTKKVSGIKEISQRKKQLDQDKQIERMFLNNYFRINLRENMKSLEKINEMVTKQEQVENVMFNDFNNNFEVSYASPVANEVKNQVQIPSNIKQLEMAIDRHMHSQSETSFNSLCDRASLTKEQVAKLFVFVLSNKNYEIEQNKPEIFGEILLFR